MANEKRLIDANPLKALFDERYDDALQECIDNAERVRKWEENRKKVKNESCIG